MVNWKHFVEWKDYRDYPFEHEIFYQVQRVLGKKRILKIWVSQPFRDVYTNYFCKWMYTDILYIEIKYKPSVFKSIVFYILNDCTYCT